jgi:hypothetical protein
MSWLGYTTERSQRAEVEGFAEEFEVSGRSLRRGASILRASAS